MNSRIAAKGKAGWQGFCPRYVRLGCSHVLASASAGLLDLGPDGWALGTRWAGSAHRRGSSTQPPIVAARLACLRGRGQDLVARTLYHVPLESTFTSR